MKVPLDHCVLCGEKILESGGVVRTHSFSAHMLCVIAQSAKVLQNESSRISREKKAAEEAEEQRGRGLR